MGLLGACMQEEKYVEIKTERATPNTVRKFMNGVRCVNCLFLYDFIVYNVLNFVSQNS